VARYLLHFAREAGFRVALVEPDAAAVPAELRSVPHHLGVSVPAGAGDADVVFTDHDRPELGPVLRDALAAGPRWVGVMGSPRHTAPHLDALARLGVPEDSIARVHRPIGLNIGSRSPAEIAISVLAGLIADRNDRPGGFGFRLPAG
jgi:xanthine/CO dehydrogenase XdhC/CoxF family maturation factor